ncbi:DsbA family protein [Henriciella aquimarina]|uniref:DsbA family protein n=1 Tax=Henriciella aquimarina TaxID=545261 RepID=UPI001301A927|nr:DsbA family protein [Henriciella aquimarina]
MRAITRRTAVLAASLLAMAACGAAGEGNGNSSSANTDGAATGDMYIGEEDAPVTLVEYASWTCPHCLQFKNDVIAKVKEEYVSTGKVKFVFREFPTAPANITVAGFAIARCAGEDKYFDVLDELFERQMAIISIARDGGQVKAALQQIAANHGITDPAAFDQCLQDSGIRKSIAAAVGQGEDAGVTGTPTVFINGEEPDGTQWRTWEGMQTALNEALGEDAPAAEPAAAESETTAPTETSDPAETPAAAGESDMDAESGDTGTSEPASEEPTPE